MDGSSERKIKKTINRKIYLPHQDLSGYSRDKLQNVYVLYFNNQAFFEVLRWIIFNFLFFISEAIIM